MLPRGRVRDVPSRAAVDLVYVGWLVGVAAATRLNSWTGTRRCSDTAVAARRTSRVSHMAQLRFADVAYIM